MLKALRAFASLGLRAFLLHPLRMLFQKVRGKELFLQNYARDGLVPYSPADRAELPRFRACINCGLCDAVCPLEAAPSLVALAHGRSTTELVALRPRFAIFEKCGECRLCVDACPRQIPLRDLFAFARRKLDEVTR